MKCFSLRYVQKEPVSQEDLKKLLEFDTFTLNIRAGGLQILAINKTGITLRQMFHPSRIDAFLFAIRQLQEASEAEVLKVESDLHSVEKVLEICRSLHIRSVNILHFSGNFTPADVNMFLKEVTSKVLELDIKNRSFDFMEKINTDKKIRFLNASNCGIRKFDFILNYRDIELVNPSLETKILNSALKCWENETAAFERLKITRNRNTLCKREILTFLDFVGRSRNAFRM